MPPQEHVTRSALQAGEGQLTAGGCQRWEGAETKNKNDRKRRRDSRGRENKKGLFKERNSASRRQAGQTEEMRMMK